MKGRRHDLSLPLDARTPPLPGDPAPSLEDVYTLSGDGARVGTLSCSLHWGTHVDAPAHMLPAGACMEELDAERLHGPACVIQLGGRKVIRPEDLPESLPAPRVLLATGASMEYGSEAYWKRHPVLTVEAARHLLDKGMLLLGMDTCSPDRAPWPVHHLLLGAGVPLVENLVGLNDLPGLVELLVAPLPLRGVEAAPARVYAWA